MTDTSPSSERRTRSILTGLALVLGTATLCSWWMGGSSTNPPAQAWGFIESTAAAAPMVTTAAGMTALIYENGGEELLMVLDGRTETIMVYQVKGNNQLELLHRAGVAQMFNDARALAGGN
jgi:hypothetical protein